MLFLFDLQINILIFFHENIQSNNILSNDARKTNCLFDRLRHASSSSWQSSLLTQASYCLLLASCELHLTSCILHLASNKFSNRSVGSKNMMRLRKSFKFTKEEFQWMNEWHFWMEHFLSIKTTRVITELSNWKMKREQKLNSNSYKWI